jgi:hypothetical protein
MLVFADLQELPRFCVIEEKTLGAYHFGVCELGPLFPADRPKSEIGHSGHGRKSYFHSVKEIASQ